MKSLTYFLIWFCSLLVLTSSATHQLREDYKVSWELDGEYTIIFTLEVRTLGYIGFGFARTNEFRMDQADIVIGGVTDETNDGYLMDRHGVGHGIPEPDAQQDYLFLESSQNETHTKIKFSRLLNTCDLEDVEITTGDMNIIWSFGYNDSLLYHALDNRGEASISLLPGFTGKRRICEAESTTIGEDTTEDSSTPGSELLTSTSNPEVSPIRGSSTESSSATLVGSSLIVTLAFVMKLFFSN